MHFIFALSFLQRLRGLLARDASWLGTKSVLVLAPCNSIHTFGMKYAIDVAFLDKCGKVLLSKENIVPSKRLRCKDAICVLERPNPSCLHAQGKKIIPWFRTGDYCKLS